MLWWDYVKIPGRLDVKQLRNELWKFYQQFWDTLYFPMKYFLMKYFLMKYFLMKYFLMKYFLMNFFLMKYLMKYSPGFWQDGQPNGGPTQNCIRTYLDRRWQDMSCTDRWNISIINYELPAFQCVMRAIKPSLCLDP